MILSTEDVFYKPFGFETNKTLDEVAIAKASVDYNNPSLTLEDKLQILTNYRIGCKDHAVVHNLVRVLAYIPAYNIVIGLMMLFDAVTLVDHTGSRSLALRGICTLVGGPLLLLVDGIYEAVIRLQKRS
jgi:hypothetical protein